MVQFKLHDTFNVHDFLNKSSAQNITKNKQNKNMVQLFPLA